MVGWPGGVRGVSRPGWFLDVGLASGVCLPMIHSIAGWKFFRDKVSDVVLWVRDLTEPCPTCGTRLRARSLWVSPWESQRGGVLDLVWHCRRCHDADRAAALVYRQRHAAGASR